MSETLPTNPPVDFAVVTALPIERDAMRDRLDVYQVIQEPDDPYTYYVGSINIPNSVDAYSVVVVMLLDPGNVEAGIGATRVIQRWQPQHVLMVGIAGGIAKAGVQRGDVVVARNVYYYEPGKRVEGGEQRRPDQYFSDFLLWGRALSYEAADWKDEVQVTPPTRKQGFVPKARFGPIASGEQVIADAASLDALRQESPKLLAVAMEGAGVARAVAATASRFMEIRGISDLADKKKDDRWHGYAANTAAAFVTGFLRSSPVVPLEHQARLRATQTETTAPPLVILRAQSLRPIRPDELLPALPEPLQARDHTTVALDFTDLSNQTRIEDPPSAVARLLDPEGGLIASLAQQEGEFIFHGLVAIPLAFTAGYLVADRRPVQFFDYHPDQDSWVWPEDTDPPPLTVSGLPQQRQTDAGDVVVRISVTLPVTSDTTEPVVPAPLAAIDLSVPAPQRNLVRREAQVRDYGRVFRGVLDDIVRFLPRSDRIHVFYSGPVSLAFHLGQQVSENIHPPVTVWNYSRGYDWAIDLEAVSRGEGGVVWTTS
ncbi:MAG: SAVED domain-containing protein [Thermomicrobiales bacterium]